MITGAHFLLYSKDPEADRAFFRDVLGWRHVDVGGGWLIFKLPPGEAAVHPRMDAVLAQRHAEHELLGVVLYLMCDDLPTTIKSLEAKNVKCTEMGEESWGIKATIRLPSGGEIGLYQPKDETALSL
jgi:predicted enzyme related to lactoylglutathione lyase